MSESMGKVFDNEVNNRVYPSFLFADNSCLLVRRKLSQFLISFFKIFIKKFCKTNIYASCIRIVIR